MNLFSWLLRPINLNTPVLNRERKFGADPYYYHARVKCHDKVTRDALFTHHDVQNAITRAEKNPGDLCSGK